MKRNIVSKVLCHIQTLLQSLLITIRLFLELDLILYFSYFFLFLPRGELLAIINLFHIEN